VVNQELATLKPGYAPSTLQIKRYRSYQISGRVEVSFASWQSLVCESSGLESHHPVGMRPNGCHLFTKMFGEVLLAWRLRRNSWLKYQVCTQNSRVATCSKVKMINFDRKYEKHRRDKYRDWLLINTRWRENVMLVLK
jgi:hypothetical protein